MNIEHLRYVLEVDRTGSISRAAENLFMGQPNLSKAIKELENALHITIFQRTSKGTKITPKGREFLRYAQSILQQYEEIEALGREEESGVQSLCISVPRASYIVNAFTTFLAGLDEERPIQIDFYETNALRAIQHVSNGHSSIGMIRCKTEYQDYFTSVLKNSSLCWRPLLEFEYHILFSRLHPLARNPEIGVEDLQPYIEIIHGDTSIPYISGSTTETERGTTPGNKKVHVYERGSQFDILSRVPRAYMWVSSMPEDLLRRNGLVQKHCRQSPRFSDFLIYPENHRFTPPEETFLALLDKSIANILATSPGTPT